MQTKRIQCPQCGVVLDVKNSKNEIVKQIFCPSCKSELQVSFEKQRGPLVAHTYLAPKKENTDDGKTLLSAATQLATQKQQFCTASLEFKGVRYPLEDGQNIIGRKGNTSKANVQIASEDRFMSRQHCCIKVSTLNDGSKKAVLSNYQNKNMTTIDGQKIEAGDEIRLLDGARITMGQTTVLFKLS